MSSVMFAKIVVLLTGIALFGLMGIIAQVLS